MVVFSEKWPPKCTSIKQQRQVCSFNKQNDFKNVPNIFPIQQTSNVYWSVRVYLDRRVSEMCRLLQSFVLHLKSRMDYLDLSLQQINSIRKVNKENLLPEGWHDELGIAFGRANIECNVRRILQRGGPVKWEKWNKQQIMESDCKKCFLSEGRAGWDQSERMKKRGWVKQELWNVRRQRKWKPKKAKNWEKKKIDVMRVI